MERQNFDYLLRVGLDNDDDNWDEAEAPSVVLQTEEGRYEEASGWGQAGHGAAAAAWEGAGELGGEGPSAAGAAGLVDEANQGRDGQENEPQPQEPDRRAMEDNEAVAQPAPAPRRKCSRFARWQLYKLESVFQNTHYIKAKARKQLAASIGVSEIKVQNWFRRKREQYKKYQKA